MPDLGKFWRNCHRLSVHFIGIPLDISLRGEVMWKFRGESRQSIELKMGEGPTGSNPRDFRIR